MRTKEASILPAGGAVRHSADAKIEVGARIKRYREQNSLTLKQIADASGVAQSTLSKIENGKLSPTLGTLQRIARGLGSDVASLLIAESSLEGTGRRSVTRSNEGKHHDSKIFRHRWLCSDLSKKQMLPFRTTVFARSLQDYTEWGYHPGEIFVYVAKNSLVIYCEHYEPLTLNEGDSLYYDGTMGHAWVSAGNRNAEVIWVFNPTAVNPSPQINHDVSSFQKARSREMTGGVNSRKRLRKSS